MFTKRRAGAEAPNFAVWGKKKYRAVGICDSLVGWETQLVKPLVYLAKGFFGSSYFVEISEV